MTQRIFTQTFGVAGAILEMVKDYFSGVKYPLNLIIHTTQPK